MVQVLSPTGVEVPEGPEQHSRALYERNLVRQNDAEKARLANSGMPFGHIGRTGGFQTLGGADIGVVITVAQELRGGMTFEAASAGRMIIPKSGLYEIRCRIYGTAGSAYTLDGGAYKNSVILPGTQATFYKATSSDIKDFTICTVPLVAGDKVGLGMTSTQSTWGTDGYNGSWLEIKYVGE